MNNGNREKRRARIRQTIRGSAQKPRLVVFRSNKYFYCQAIDDDKGRTLASVNKANDASMVGSKIAKELLTLNIKKVVFDRAGYLYHGNILKIADSARKEGLVF